MIRIENLVKFYGKNKVLDGLNIDIKQGEIYGFIGQNGAGKSTTMNILTRIIKFQQGSCIVNNKDITRKNFHPKEIGYLPEDPKFYDYMTTIEYLAFLGNLCNYSKTDLSKKVNSLIEIVKLDKAKNKPIGTFSRGMKQRLGIAAAIFNDPQTLILDEPSSALDPSGRMDITDIIKNLKSLGKTIMISTHILNDIEKICDRIGIIKNGKIIIEDDLDSLLKKYIKPIYDIEFDKPIIEKDIIHLKKIDYIEHININNGILSIQVKNINSDGINLIKIITELGILPISINQRRQNLDEIYLEVSN